MLKDYETVFILNPVLSDEQMKDAAAKFVKVLTDQGAEIINEERWGLRKLAYPIQHKTTGFYVLVEFKAEPNVIAILDTEYRRDERVMRYLTTALDKYAVAYNERRRRGDFRKNKKDKEAKEEPAS
jgi:small subunit ribosomal protein S6